MYGVPSDTGAGVEQHLHDSNISSVFVPADQKSIASFSKAGFQVFLTLSVFGGSEAWKKYPDAQPITASGNALSPSLGGVCPTHFAWRQERLALLAAWLQHF